MAVLNPRYEDIGKEFVTQYYALFDDPNQRPNLIHLFNVSKLDFFFKKFFFQFANFKQTIKFITFSK